MTEMHERTGGSRRRLVGKGNNLPASCRDTRALQLRAAMEILAEVFGTDISDVKRMLKQRCEEVVPWPQEFHMGR
jgi:hypothetical protein